LSAKIEELQSIIFIAEDGVFQAFCRQIRVSNIREYEERQLKVAQEESEARLRFDTQIARLTHQYASPSFVHVELRPDFLLRSEFEEDQMKATTERLTMLETTSKAEQATLSKLEEQKQAIQNEIAEIENAITMLQEELKGLNDILEDKTKTVEQVKRTTSKAAKGLDQALKEVSSKVSPPFA